MEGVESKSQSQGQDSQIMSENSKCLAENVEGKIFMELESLHNLSFTIQINYRSFQSIY